MNNVFRGFSRSGTGEQHFASFQHCSTNLVRPNTQKRKTECCYGKFNYAVTQRWLNDYAVHAVQADLTGFLGEVGNPLRQKPTSIERGVPVGTKESDRNSAQREFCRHSSVVRAMDQTGDRK
jgi:hypothetical protein